MRLKNRDARIDALREVPVFATLPKGDLNTLAKHTDVVDRDAGTVLCQQGKVGKQLVYIATGAAEVDIDGRKVATLGPGDVIGELSLIDGKPGSATVTLTEDSHLLAMSLSDFQTVMAESPRFQTNLLKAVVQRLRATDEKLVA